MLRKVLSDGVSGGVANEEVVERVEDTPRKGESDIGGVARWKEGGNRSGGSIRGVSGIGGRTPIGG